MMGIEIDNLPLSAAQNSKTSDQGGISESTHLLLTRHERNEERQKPVLALKDLPGHLGQLSNQSGDISPTSLGYIMEIFAFRGGSKLRGLMNYY